MKTQNRVYLPASITVANFGQLAGACANPKFGCIEAPTVRVVNGQTEGIAAQFLNLQTGLPLILDLGIKLAAILLAVLLAFGGFRYMISIGNEEGSEQAKRLITSAVVGFALLLGTWAIMRFVFALLKYPF